MPEIDDDKSRRSRGWKRMRELDQQETADRLALEAELVADLGRRPTALDRIAIEFIASAAVKARRLRAAGKDDVEQQRLIAQLLRATGLKPDKPVSAKQEDFSDQMQRLAMPQGGDDEEAD